MSWHFGGWHLFEYLEVLWIGGYDESKYYNDTYPIYMYIPNIISWYNKKLLNHTFWYHHQKEKATLGCHILHTPQACTENRRVLCANIVLDKDPGTLEQRLANRVYESCRAETLKVTGFPQFAPVIAALQNVQATSNAQEYQVTVKKHDRLVVLQSLSEKWLSTEFKDATTAEIESHNEKFNQGGEYWHQEEQRPVWVLRNTGFVS